MILLEKLLSAYADQLDTAEQSLRTTRAKGLPTSYQETQVERLSQTCEQIRHQLHLDTEHKRLVLRANAQAEKIQILEKRIRDLTSCLKELNVSVRVKGSGISVKKAGQSTALQPEPCALT